MTITWHIDDLKVSHNDYHEVTKFSMYLGALYGNRITVNRGDVHDYLRMDLDYSQKKELLFSLDHRVLVGHCKKVPHCTFALGREKYPYTNSYIVFYAFKRYFYSAHTTPNR